MALLEFKEGNVEIQFIGNHIQAMHLCEVKPQYPFGINIASYTGDYAFLWCRACKLRFEFNWKPEASEEENLILLRRQLKRHTPKLNWEYVKKEHSQHGERGQCAFEGCETEPCPTYRKQLKTKRSAQ